jgi:exodeoxyribonuclease-3
MKLATWNVNSLKVRLAQVLEFLAAQKPDVLVLQETKLEDDKFSLSDLNTAGYQAVFCGQKTYNGVAILSRYCPSTWRWASLDSMIRKSASLRRP